MTPCWHYSGFPTAPGLYVVRSGSASSMRVLWWGKQNRDWRWGARRIEVDAFYGPIERPKPYAEVDF